MRKTEQGFSGVEALLIVLVVVLIGGVAFSVYHRNHQANSSITASTTSKPAPSSVTPAATNGTTASINSLTTQDARSESSIDSKYSASAQSTAGAANGPAANLGGAYDESAL